MGVAEEVTLVGGSSLRSSHVAWLGTPDAVSDACGITVVNATLLGTVHWEAASVALWEGCGVLADLRACMLGSW